MPRDSWQPVCRNKGVLPDLWAVLLAGGAGRRLIALSGGVPKQFWAFKDGPTLVEETARRIAPLAPAEQRVTVVDATHERYVESLRYQKALGQIVYQPTDRGTVAGVLLGLTPVLAADPDAIVLITPADHGVVHVDQFHRGILSAVALVRTGGRDVVLFGIEAAAPASDYGWITPRTSGCVGRFAKVSHFCEKPGAAEAERLYVSGSVWNTMVLVGRAGAIFAECQRHVPNVAAMFLAARLEPDSRRSEFYAAHYPALPSSDFSRDVVARASGLALYTWPRRMGWSDLGTPERLREWREGAAPPAMRSSRKSAGVPLTGVA